MEGSVFITGASGYIGRRLSAALLARGHGVTGLVRRESPRPPGPGYRAVVGDELDAASYRDALSPSDTLVHLVGVAHPSPSKAEQFRTVDLASVDGALAAATRADIRRFVYVSVAQPAPIMREYIAMRRLGEERIAASGLASSILRPWYVLGPGHFWPVALLPLYGLARLVPRWRDTASRLGLVTIQTMVRALTACVERPSGDTEVLDVAAIRAAGRSAGR